MHWPAYGSRRLSPRYAGTLARALVRVRWRQMALPALLVVLYAAALLVPLPFAASASWEETPLSRWWFLRLGDLLFTGGAFGRIGILGAVFAVFLTPRLGGARSLRRLAIFLAAQSAAAVLVWSAYVQQRLVEPGGWGRAALGIGLLALAGTAAKFVDLYLLERGAPALSLLHLVILFAGAVPGPRLTGQLAAGWPEAAPALAFVATALAVVAGYHLWFRRGVAIEIEQVRSVRHHRFSQLLLEGGGREIWDGVFFIAILCYFFSAVPLTVALGVPALAAQPPALVVAPQVLSLLIVWLLLPLLGPLLGAERGQTLAGKLKRKFWVVVGQPPGEATARHIDRRLAAVRRRRFALVALWVTAGNAAFFELARRGEAAAYFPFGPLVFVYLVFGLWTYLAQVARRVVGRVRTLGHEVRRAGERLLELFGSEAAAPVDVFAGSERRSTEPSLSEYIEDLAIVLRTRPQREAAPGGRRVVRAIALRTLPLLLSGLVTTTLVGALLVFFEVGRENLVLTLIGSFLAGLGIPTLYQGVLAGVRR